MAKPDFKLKSKKDLLGKIQNRKRIKFVPIGDQYVGHLRKIKVFSVGRKIVKNIR